MPSSRNPSHFYNNEQVDNIVDRLLKGRGIKQRLRVDPIEAWKTGLVDMQTIRDYVEMRWGSSRQGVTMRTSNHFSSVIDTRRLNRPSGWQFSGFRWQNSTKPMGGRVSEYSRAKAEAFWVLLARDGVASARRQPSTNAITCPIFPMSQPRPISLIWSKHAPGPGNGQS